jgi:hypothetical protein
MGKSTGKKAWEYATLRLKDKTKDKSKKTKVAHKIRNFPLFAEQRGGAGGEFMGENKQIKAL